MYFDTLGALQAGRNIAVLFNVRKVINFQEFQRKVKTTTANTCCHSPQKKIQSNVHPRIRKVCKQRNVLKYQNGLPV